MVRVVLEKSVVYELIASMDEFAGWMNEPIDETRPSRDFKEWVRKDGSMIYIHRLGVLAAYGKEDS